MNELTKSLKHIGACSEAIEWAKPYDTLQAAWDACDRSDWMLWLLNAVNPKRDDLFPVAASFTEHALGHVSDALDSAAGAAGMPEESSVSLRSHSAILRGLRIDSRDAAWAASDAAWAARAAAGAASGAAGEARAAAWAASAAAWAASGAAGAASAAAGAASDAAGAARDAAGAARDAAGAARDAAGEARAAAWAASAAAGAARDAAGAARDAAGAARDAAGAAEMKWQADYIREKFACPVVAP